MKRHKSEAQKTKPLKLSDFPPPNRVSRQKASDICEWLGASGRLVEEVQNYLDDLVDYVRESMSQRKTTDLKGDRDHISNARDRIIDIRKELLGMGIDGRLAVRTTAERLSDILSGDWIRHQFPNDAPSKQMLGGDRAPMRVPARVSTEADIFHSDYQFIRGRAPEILDTLLSDLETALASALISLNSQPGALGGRKALTHRHLVILNLANLWLRIGKEPVSTPGSLFAVFCEEIFKAIGWPVRGIEAAIPDALKNLRN
jgi:hypothetical protein